MDTVLARTVKKVTRSRDNLQQEGDAIGSWKGNVYRSKAQGWQTRANTTLWDFRQRMEAEEGLTALPNVARSMMRARLGAVVCSWKGGHCVTLLRVRWDHLAESPSV